jgi:hypothetical protein
MSWQLFRERVMSKPERHFLRDNGLTIVLMAIFLATLAGTIGTGWLTYQDELQMHGQQPLSLLQYLASAHLISAVFENWESEFLQMAAFVALTAILFQRGSAESLDPDDLTRPKDAKRHPRSFGAWLYAYSLSLMLAALFVMSFALHLWGSSAKDTKEALMHGEPTPHLWQHLGSSGFWFESFQNWQSEFLSTGVLVVLSIFLRHQGSPQSKPLRARNSDTGSE